VGEDKWGWFGLKQFVTIMMLLLFPESPHPFLRLTPLSMNQKPFYKLKISNFSTKCSMYPTNRVFTHEEEEDDSGGRSKALFPVGVCLHDETSQRYPFFLACPPPSGRAKSF
jgi:hypothetical protein